MGGRGEQFVDSRQFALYALSLFPSFSLTINIYVLLFDAAHKAVNLCVPQIKFKSLLIVVAVLLLLLLSCRCCREAVVTCVAK